MAVKIFRWKAIGPLALLLVLIGVLLWLFAEPVAKDTAEEVSTELLGTQVDVGKLDIIADEASVDLRALQIADPFNPNKNLVEAAEIRLKLNPIALAEKKFVVENFRLSGMRFGTGRKKPARPVKGDGFAPQALRAVRQWSQQFDVPILKLTPDRHHQAAGAESDPAHHGEVGTGACRPRRFGAARARPILPAARRQRDRGYRAGTGGAAPGHQPAQARPRRHPAGDRRRARARSSALEDAKKRLETLERQVQGGVGTLASGLEIARRGAKKGLRLRQVAAASSRRSRRRRSARRSSGRSASTASSRRCTTRSWPGTTCRRACFPGRTPGPSGCARRGRASGFPRRKSGRSSWSRLGQMDLAIGGDSPLRGAYAAGVAGPHLGPARSTASRPWCAPAVPPREAPSPRSTCARSSTTSAPTGSGTRHRRGSAGYSSRASRCRGSRSPSSRAPAAPTSASLCGTSSCPAGGRSAPTRSPGRSTAPGRSSIPWSSWSGGWSPDSSRCRWMLG